LKNTYTVNDLEFLISTQNQVSLDFLIPIFKGYDLTKTPILIINQTQSNVLLRSEFDSIRVINSFETGVAKSRNLALQNALGKIVIFTDDDVEYFENTREIIIDAYNNNAAPDAILFQAQKNSTQLLKPYANKPQDPITTLSILNCGTIEITLKTENIDSSIFKFDERFGNNSFFELGDEPLFLMNLKRNNKRIIFINKTIVQHEGVTTVLRNSKEINYFGLGAFYKQIFPKHHYLWVFVKIFFDVKQGKITVFDILKVLSSAAEGRKKLIATKTKI
jgi:glycosyltransferase involved in cell wall biosynthesis